MSEAYGKTAAIVLAGGTGTRMGSAVPKQYMPLMGQPVLCYSLQAFENSPLVDEIILVAEKEAEEHLVNFKFDKLRCRVEGGAERFWSVAYGLRACDQDTAYVLIHDGARPLLDEGIIERTLAGAKQAGGAVAAMPVKDTIKRVNAEGFAIETPDRKALWQMQTPQTFSYPLIFSSYNKLVQQSPLPSVTDDAEVAELMSGHQSLMVEGSYRNIKLTTPEDLLIAEAFLKEARPAHP